MTDEETLIFYEKMKLHYGDRLPNPEHEPLQFSYFVKLYKYFHVIHTQNS